jgi:hypothetical protein
MRFPKHEACEGMRCFMPLSGQAPMKCKQEQTDKVAILLNLKRKRWHRGLDDADEDLLESGG